MRNWIKAGTHIVLTLAALFARAAPAPAVVLDDWNSSSLGTCFVNAGDTDEDWRYLSITGGSASGWALANGYYYVEGGAWEYEADTDTWVWNSERYSITAETVAACLGAPADVVTSFSSVGASASLATDVVGFGFILSESYAGLPAGEFISYSMGGVMLPPVSGPSAAEVTVSAVVSDISRVTASAVSGNARMMSGGFGRFASGRKSGQSNADAISTSSVQNIAITPELSALGEQIDLGGTFYGQSVSADGVYRKVSFGEFDVQHTVGSGTTLSFNGRMAWERAAGEDAMVAYFLGAEVNKSDVEGVYTGDMNRVGVSAGVYGFKALADNLFLGGFGSLGVSRSEMDTTDGADSNITGDYLSRTLSLGAQLSGSVEYDTFEVRPSASLSYVKTFVGDITLDNSGETLEVPLGNTAFAGLTLSPEFLFPMEQQNGSNMTAVASVAPRVLCEMNEASDTITRECGAGITFGINGTSEDGATNLNASIRFDRVGGVDRKGLNLQAEFRF